MPETDEVTAYIEWHRSLSESDVAAFRNLRVTGGLSMVYWLDWMDTDGTVRELRGQILGLQRFFEKRGPLRREYLSALVHGELGLVMKYLEKFDDETPAEEVSKQLVEDVRRLRQEVSGFLEEE